jgi:hypothetical protein
VVKSFRARAHSKCHVGALSKDSTTENSEMSAAPDSSPCSIHESVQSAFAVNDLAVLQDCCADLERKINAKYRRVPFSE